MKRGAADEGSSPSTSPLDFAHLDEQTLGDRALQRELLSLFASQSPPLLARMRELGRDDMKAFGDLAHHLKGSARAIGAFGVAAAAERLETQPRCSGGPPALAALAEALAEAVTAIDVHLQASPP